LRKKINKAHNILDIIMSLLLDSVRGALFLCAFVYLEKYVILISCELLEQL